MVILPLIYPHHLCVWADEAGVLGAAGGRPQAVHRLGGGETQGLAAAQGGRGQTPLASSAAVVWDAECAALVVVKSTACRGRHGPPEKRGEDTRWVGFLGEKSFGPAIVSHFVPVHYSPSHLSPCLTSPNSISPQWSQKAGARYECTLRACGRIWKSSNVAAAKTKREKREHRVRGARALEN